MDQLAPETTHDSATLSREVVSRIAALAQLELSEEEITLYQGQLSHVLAYFQQISAVDTADIQTNERPAVTPDQLRPDIAAAPLTTEQALANAPDRTSDQFRVPAVLPDSD